MRDVLETVRKQQLTSAPSATSTHSTASTTTTTTTNTTAYDDDRLVENLLNDVRRSEENNRPTEGGKAKSGTLTGATDELTEFERAVLNKYIRELQETAGAGSTVQANDQGDDSSVRDNRLRTMGGVELDENANPLAGVAATPDAAQPKSPHTSEEAAGMVDNEDEDLPVTASTNPQVVTHADASTLTSTGTTSSISSSNNCTTTALTISNCSNIIAANNNSNERIGNQSKGDERNAKPSDPMEGDANTNNDHNSVAAPSISCSTNTTTTTNDNAAQRWSEAESASTTAASSTMATMGAPAAATSAAGGGDATVARETMAANRSRAMRRNFSVWVGVTSCVWGLLLYLIKTYT